MSKHPRQHESNNVMANALIINLIALRLMCSTNKEVLSLGGVYRILEKAILR